MSLFLISTSGTFAWSRLQKNLTGFVQGPGNTSHGLQARNPSRVYSYRAMGPAYVHSNYLHIDAYEAAIGKLTRQTNHGESI